MKASAGDSEESPGSSDGRIDRVRGFSDGVFAVAITLLVLNIEVPRGSGEPLGQVMSDLTPYIISYFIAFFVIGMFWFGHHVVWDTYTRVTPSLIWLNTALLAVIVLIPFTTSIIGEYDDAGGFTIYAINLGLAAMLDAAVDWLAHRQGVVDPTRSEPVEASSRAGMARALIFIGSIPLALIDVTLAQLSWLLLIPLPNLVGRLGGARASSSADGR